MPLLLIVTMVISCTPASADSWGDTHIDHIDPITINTGETAKITAQLWISNGMWNNPGTWRNLRFIIKDETGNELFNQKKETNWPDGEASVQIKLDTPGTYYVTVTYNGNNGQDLNACHTNTTITVKAKTA